MILSLLLLGCKSGPVAISDISAETSTQVVTAINVSWTTDVESSGYVEYGLTDAYGEQTPMTAAGTSHITTILMPSDAEVHYRVVVPGEEDSISSDAMANTGTLPSNMPLLELTGDAIPDQFMILPVLGSVTAPVIVDGSGEIRWYHIDDRGLDVYRALPSVDGKSILYNAASVSGDPAEDSMIVRVALDGSWEETIEIPLLAHDFVEHPDGTLGVMVTEFREGSDGKEVRGDSIVEIATDGTMTTVWSAWDCFDPDVEEVDETEDGWTFGNALDYDPDEGVYYQGMRNFSSIARIDPATGTCEWVFGSIGATIEPDSGAATFLHQHQFHVLDDSILIFDNDGALSTSRAIEFAMADGAVEWEDTWSYTPDPSIYTFVLGDVHRFDDGDTLITWSVSGQIDRVSSAGTVDWQLNSALGYAFGFNTVLSTPYPE
jgi:outer membrane protein assembly factor BamB